MTNYPLYESSVSPVYTREECIKRITHGAGRFLSNQDGEKKVICHFCCTEFTKQDNKDRIKAFGGPGHWSDCILDKEHEGDCLVKKER